MKTTEQKVPALRFPEFEGEWKVKKLGEVVEYVKGYAFKSEDYLDSGIRIIRVSDLDKDSIKETNEKVYISYSQQKEYSKYLISQNEIIVTTVGSKPDLEESAVGRGVLIKTDAVGLLNQNMLKLNVTDKIINPFLFGYINTSKYKKHINVIQRGNANQSNITLQELFEYKISFPSLFEQQKIADFLSVTDKRLELLKEKKQGLEDYKRGAMQGIFSQELRFTRADGSAYEDWEEKKLGEVCEVMRGTSFSKSEMVEEGEMKCIHYGELFTEYKEVISFISSRTNITKGVFSHKGDVLMPTSDVTPNGLARASALSIENVLLGGDMNIIRIQKRLLSVFLSYFLNFDKQNIIRLVTGTTVKHIYASDIKSLDIPLPSLSEQAQIANFLSAIDVKIEKLSEQIEATENYKKGLLQQMFV